MAEFTPIETQEAFDAAIKDRIARLNEKHSKEISEKYGDYDALKETASKNKELADQIEKLTASNTEFEKQIKEKDEIITKHTISALKTKVASEEGLSLDSIKFLTGTNEEEIKTSASELKKLIGVKVTPLAGATHETDSRKVELKNMLDKLKN